MHSDLSTLELFTEFSVLLLVAGEPGLVPSQYLAPIKWMAVFHIQFMGLPGESHAAS